MNIRNILIVAGVAGLVGFIFWFSMYQSMSEQPMANHMINLEPIVEVINIPEFTTIELLGKRRFDENCAMCHGENATGRNGIAPPLVHIIYEPNHHGDMSFQLAAKNGVRAHHWPFGDMPAVPAVSEKDVENIIAYIRKLQQANGIF
jgi:cytochrome c2